MGLREYIGILGFQGILEMFIAACVLGFIVTFSYKILEL